jgi:tryptophanyl-tRNA synthetase
MLADLHAITVPQDPAALTAATREVAAAYIAAGIDTNKSVIFPQSAVSAHAELAWILNCHTPLGWLNRMTQFKEKSGIGSNDLFKDMVELFYDHDDFLAGLFESHEGGFRPIKSDNAEKSI